MDRIRIRKAARLQGEIPISGAKNAALKLMAASLLTAEPLVLSNVPRLADVRAMADLLKSFGVAVERTPGTSLGEGDTYRFEARTIASSFASYDMVRKMRASFQVLAPLVARHDEAKVSLPGGCAIGARPVDMHLKALEALGAEVSLADGYVLAKAPPKRNGEGGLRGGRIEFAKVSVGATETALMSAVLAKGKTEIGNAAREPEIEDLCLCLIAMGAKISGLGSGRLIVEGVSELHGATYAVMPDRIESGTYAIALALTGGELELIGARRDNNTALYDLLERAGTDIQETKRGIRLYRNGAPPAAVEVTTAPFPGFPTDLQAQLMALMTIAEGTSIIRETIFENRFMHVPELGRLGADIRVHGDVATVRGVAKLKGAPVMATDLRASVSLVLAGLVAEGETVVNRVYHLDRGFDRLEEKLRAVGADIAREKE